MKHFVWWYLKQAGPEHRRAMEKSLEKAFGGLWVGLLCWAFLSGSPVGFFLACALPAILTAALLFAEYRDQVKKGAVE